MRRRKGREIDHLGFDVRNLDDFEKRLAAQGLKFEAPPRAGAEYADQGGVPHRSVGSLYRSHRAAGALTSRHLRVSRSHL